MKKLFLLVLLAASFCFEVHSQDYWQSVGSIGGSAFSFVDDGKGNILSATINGIFKSTDDGDTWVKKSTSTRCISFGVNKQYQIFSGTHSNTILTSSDNGESWSNITSLQHPDGRPISFLKNGDMLVDSGNKGLFRSTDNGATWSTQIVDTIPLLIVWSIVETSNGIVFAGTDHNLYFSIDFGYNWTPIILDSLCPEIRMLLITKNGDLYAGSKSMWCGIFKSTNQGVTWEKAFEGIDLNLYEYIWDMVESPNGRIYISTFADGVYASFDKGKTAQKVAPNIPTINYYWQLFISQGGHLFVGTDKGIYRSKEIVSDVETQNHLQEVKLLPEIIDGSIQSEISVNVSGNFSFEITDITGKSVFLQKATDYLKLNTENLEQGIFFYKLISGIELKTGKFVKI